MKNYTEALLKTKEKGKILKADKEKKAYLFHQNNNTEVKGEVNKSTTIVGI